MGETLKWKQIYIRLVCTFNNRAICIDTLLEHNSKNTSIYALQFYHRTNNEIHNLVFIFWDYSNAPGLSNKSGNDSKAIGFKDIQLCQNVITPHHFAYNNSAGKIIATLDFGGHSCSLQNNKIILLIE